MASPIARGADARRRNVQRLELVEGRQAEAEGSSKLSLHSKSFLNPTGTTANSPPPKEMGVWTELLVFLIFVGTSAFKMIITDASKSLDPETGKKVFRYQANSTIVLTSILLAVVSVVLCLAIGGTAQLAIIWRRKPFLIFSMNGIAFAFGDCLQMASMSSLHGAAYQIMVQSRIIITAGLLICVKGVYQTRLQWVLLLILMMSMSAYMVIESSSKAQGGDVPVLGILLALLKTLVSCLVSVVIDKYTKVYKDDPTHIQLARISIARCVVLVLYSFTGEVWTNGLFSGWDSTTYAVVGGYFAKEVSALYITALLDSVLRNIGEAFSVPVIYAHDVLAPWSAKSFDISTFLAVLVVVAGCVAYVDSKVPIEKAARYDELQRASQDDTAQKATK